MAQVWDSTNNGGRPEDWVMDEILTPEKLNREVRDRLDYLMAMVYTRDNRYGNNSARFNINPNIPTSDFMTHPDVWNNTDPEADFLVGAYTGGRIFVSINGGTSWRELPSGAVPFTNSKSINSDDSFTVYCTAANTPYVVPGMSRTITKQEAATRLLIHSRAVFARGSTAVGERWGLAVKVVGAATGDRGTTSRGPIQWVIPYKDGGDDHTALVDNTQVTTNLAVDTYTVSLCVVNTLPAKNVNLGYAPWNSAWTTYQNRQHSLFVAEV